MSNEADIAKPDSIPKKAGVIYHHSIGSGLTHQAIHHPGPKLLVYHNITPSEFVSPFDRDLSEQLSVGRKELKNLSKYFPLSAGVSNYNSAELESQGFHNPDVLPIVVDPEKWRTAPDRSIMTKLQDGWTNLLFVGRITPNKCQHHLIEAFYCYLTMNPDARLILVGAFTPGDPYCEFILDEVKRLGVKDNVIITRLVSDSELHAYYRTASLFWSMSEHEGFGVPFIEAFWFDVPVLAYKSSAVPETLAKAGLLFTSKEDLFHIAALAKILAHDQKLRRKVLKAQRNRRVDFLPKSVYPKIGNLISKLERLI
jgi:glycosyltransferase involved in cell wall biosynthesis